MGEETLGEGPVEDPAGARREGRPVGRWVLIASVLVAVVALAAVPLESVTGRDSRSSNQSAAAGGQMKGPVPEFAGRPTRAQKALLDQATGFGGRVTGGAGGRVARVTSDEDSGRGSLREAVEGDAPKWVVFDRDLTIRLRTPVLVGSNTTLDGRGRRVVLEGGGRTLSGLVVRDVHNVVVESLTLTGFGRTGAAALEDPSDGLNVNHAVGVWVDHLDLSRAADKGIVVVGSRGVTLSWNHVHDQREVLQIGNQKTKEESSGSTVTVDHNFFDHDGLRMPEVAYAKVHVFGNYYLDWGGLAVRSSRDAQVALEGNVFEGKRSRLVSRTIVAGSGCNTDLTRCDAAHGALRAEGNQVSGAEQPVPERAATVFDPAHYYSYDTTPASPGLAAAVRASAGPQP